MSYEGFMQLAFVIALALMTFGIFVIQAPEEWRVIEKSIVCVERRAYHKAVRGFKRVCRRAFALVEEVKS